MCVCVGGGGGGGGSALKENLITVMLDQRKCPFARDL